MVLVSHAFAIGCLYSQQSDPKSLLVAARTGDVAGVRAALAAGADVDVNAKTRYGATALSFACMRGNSKIVKLLIEAGADVNVRDSFYGSTPLNWALYEENLDVVKLLIDGGATDLDLALSTYVTSKNVEMVRLILDTGRASEEAVRDAMIEAGKDEGGEILALLKSQDLPEEPPAQPVSADQLDRYAGTFAYDGATRVELVRRDDQLYLKTAAAEVALQSFSPTQFRYANVKLDFEINDERVVAFSQRTPYGTFRFQRVDPQDASQEDTKDVPVLSPQEEAALAAADRSVSSPHWPQFRGRGARGIADGWPLPLEWDAAKPLNIRWSVPIPGQGHASPVIQGDRIYIATAISDDGNHDVRVGLYGDVDSVEDDAVFKFELICLDKHSGEMIWQKSAAESVPLVKRHLKSTHANPTPATDGKYVVVSFGSHGLFCFDTDGNLVWKKDFGRLDSGWFYDPSFEWGFGSSPVIHGNLAIMQCDVQEGSFIAAFELATGEEVWRTERDEIPTWSTPTVHPSPDGALLLTNGTHYARGYDADTGKLLWQLGGNSEIVVPTPFVADDLVFIASGYRPVQPIHAVRLNARGDITPQSDNPSAALAWTVSRGGPYMPTPLAYRDLLYTCSNNGIVTCYHATTGIEIYKRRLTGGGLMSFVASPVAGEGHLYFTSEDGTVHVVKVGREFEQVAENALGEYCLATPAISEGVIYFRGQRQLFAVQSTETEPPSEDAQESHEHDD
jgi:outer membrane protein assembly factor BamB